MPGKICLKSPDVALPNVKISSLYAEKRKTCGIIEIGPHRRAGRHLPVSGPLPTRPAPLPAAYPPRLPRPRRAGTPPPTRSTPPARHPLTLSGRSILFLRKVWDPTINGIAILANRARLHPRRAITGPAHWQPPGGATSLQKPQAMAREAMMDLRMPIFELHPPLLQEKGLVGALRAWLAAVETRAGLQTDLRVDGIGGPGQPEPKELDGAPGIGLWQNRSLMGVAAMRQRAIRQREKASVQNDGPRSDLGRDVKRPCKGGWAGSSVWWAAPSVV